ncbi:Hypothetical predicted protein [Podarcis lilfordi]|uniref:Uncharacterized protein n=1 Tax=Podarcis lilfordi TaxID=74358 RepID=A0AA35JXJ8_9SAUR|nr:Hypothetical predicted protein [Podarcis lilfordi]
MSEQRKTTRAPLKLLTISHTPARKKTPLFRTEHVALARSQACVCSLATVGKRKRHPRFQPQRPNPPQRRREEGGEEELAAAAALGARLGWRTSRRHHQQQQQEQHRSRWGVASRDSHSRCCLTEEPHQPVMFKDKWWSSEQSSPTNQSAT